MEAIINSAIWRFLGWLPSFILGWIFSPKWLDSKVNIDIRPRHQSVEICQPENPEVVICLEIRNGSHFNLLLDRIVCKFIFGIEICQPIHLKRINIKPGESADVYLTQNIPSAQFSKLPFHYKNNIDRARLELFAEFESKFHKFTSERNLDGIKPKIMNEHLLQDSLQGK